MTRWFFIFVVLTTLPFRARAQETANERFEVGIFEFRAAYQAWDADSFAAAAKLFRQAHAEDRSTVDALYWLGVAEFHRAIQLGTLPSSRANTEQIAFSLDAAVEALQALLKLDDRHAESHALLGTIYGIKIDGNWLRALRYGPRVQKHAKKAMEFGAGNPRVQYLMGTCQFHLAKKPKSQREALETFLEAERLFLREQERPAEPMEPRWGFSSCLTFLGRSYELLEDPRQAAAAYRRAVALHPADRFAQEGLERVTKRSGVR